FNSGMRRMIAERGGEGKGGQREGGGPHPPALLPPSRRREMGLSENALSSSTFVGEPGTRNAGDLLPHRSGDCSPRVRDGSCRTREHDSELALLLLKAETLEAQRAGVLTGPSSRACRLS